MPDTATPHLSEAYALDEASQTLKRTRDSLNRIANEAAACCSDTMSAAIESGAEASRRMQEVGGSIFTSYMGAVTTFTDLGRDTLTCRTPADAAALQKKTFEAFTATMDASSKFYDSLFNAWSQSMTPVVARAADTPERMFRAIAD